MSFDRTIGPLDIRFPDGVDERERIVAGQVGALSLAAWDSGPGEVMYTPRHVRRSDPDMFRMYVHTRGRVVGEQAGRQAEVGPGDLTLVDPGLPFRCIHDSSTVIQLAIPRRLLPVHQQGSDVLAGVWVPGDTIPGGLLSSMVSQLPGHLDSLDAHEGFRVCTAVVDLLSATLSASNGGADGKPRRQALVERILAYIEDQLGDPELSPARVAQTHHISIRYLHKLFAEQNITVAGFIRNRRLERSRRDLLDPAQRSRPVSAIGARYGFTDPAHFSRVFRAAYGSPPGAYRRVALG